ncbi:translation initiation factor [Vicingaceae bacterium]|jgi:translation initiation factor 1|nr:translation initiation factor [Vicingaceae bacterium]
MSKRKNIVYSTNPNYDYDDENDELDTLQPQEQNLKVLIDRKQRKGKSVTIVTGFEGSDEDIKDLAKTLKSKCGVGGAAKDGEILIQGEFKEKILSLLIDMGYKRTKKVGG